MLISDEGTRTQGPTFSVWADGEACPEVSAVHHALTGMLTFI